MDKKCAKCHFFAKKKLLVAVEQECCTHNDRNYNLCTLEHGHYGKCGENSKNFMLRNTSGEVSPCGCVCCEHCGGVEMADTCTPERHNAIEKEDCQLPDN